MDVSNKGPPHIDMRHPYSLNRLRMKNKHLSWSTLAGRKKTNYVMGAGIEPATVTL